MVEKVMHSAIERQRGGALPSGWSEEDPARELSSSSPSLAAWGPPFRSSYRRGLADRQDAQITW